MVTNNLTIEEIRKICSKIEDEIINLYLKRYKQKYICEKLNIKRGKIDLTVKKYNLTRFRDRKNSLCENINTEEPEFWYFLGLFASDGNLYLKSKSVNTIQFTLDDKEALEWVQSILKCNNKIRCYKKLGKYRYYLSISDSHLIKTVQDIFDDLCYRKTSSIKFPKIPNENSMKMFLRGFFDGDGSYTKSAINGFYNFKLYCASKDFITSLYNTLILIIPKEKVHLYKNAYIEINSQYSVYLLSKFLYSYKPFIGINRKRERAMQHIENYELKI